MRRQGNWAAAIRHRLRAVARQLEEDGVLNPVPGRTATELAADAGAAVPGLAGELTASRKGFQRRHLRRAARHRARLPDDRRPRRPSAVPRCDDGRPTRDARPDGHLDGGPMTDVDTAVAPTVRQRWRSGPLGRLALVVITAVAAVDHISDGTPARRPDGPCRHVSRRRSRPGRAAARPRRRRGRRRRHRRRSNGRHGRTPW